tara:strand:+ start:97 stop:489 length:393 start_codon:yes stop_codon:yes gene_type:complete
MNHTNTISNAYIYAIKCNKTKEIYIGSSYIPMNLRLMKHKTDFNGFMGINKKWRNYRSSFEVMFNEDYEMFKIEELTGCQSKQELEEREGKHILKNKYIHKDKCVNKRMPRKMKAYSLEDLSDVPCPSLI